MNGSGDMVELEYSTLQAENSAMFERRLNNLMRENHGWKVESCGMSMRTKHERYDMSEEVWWAILSRPIPEWKRDMR